MKTTNAYLRLLLTMAVMSVVSNTNAQIGSTCNQADPIASSTLCNYSSHTTTGTEYWLSFVATSPTVNISLITTKYGIDAPHIHGLNLYSGACSSLTLVEEDELPFYDEADRLQIDLNASNLVLGNTYYIMAAREGSVHECPRSNCKLNGSTDPTTFSLCVQDINVVIPPDFGGEKPVVSLALETNRGQLVHVDGTPADEVKMFNENMNPALYVCDDRVSYVVWGDDNGTASAQRVDMKFSGSNLGYGIFKTEKVQGISNYYLEHIPDGVVRNKSYSRVVSNEIYPFIDMQHYSNKEGMKNYFVVNPGGDPNDIVLEFIGADNVSIGASGELIISATLGDIVFELPHCYQINPAGNVVPMPWQGNYEMVTSNKVKFDLMNYPHNMPLFIQMDHGHSVNAPKNIDNLVWSTYYGGTDSDYFYDVETDVNGDVYFSGYTRGLTFPHTTQTIYPAYSWTPRMVCGKHNAFGPRVWSTIYGAEQDAGLGLALDNLNNVYVVGTNSTGGVNHFLAYDQGGGAYFLAPSPSITNNVYGSLFRFNQNNGVRTWASMFGEHSGAGASHFELWCVETDDNNNVYVGGKGKRFSSSPIVASGSQYSQTTNGTSVGVLLKFNAGVNTLAWSTMFGNDDLIVEELSLTSSGDLYVIGTTSGANVSAFPLAQEETNDYQQTYGGGSSDAFFAKFDVNNELKWSSFLGGTGAEQGLGLSYTESENSLLLTGSTTSDNTSFPLMALANPAVHFDNTLQGGKDGFLTVLDWEQETTGGHVLYYSSFYGGAGDDDVCRAIEITGWGNIFMVGSTNSLDFPLNPMTNGYNQDILENDLTGIHQDSYVIGMNSLYELDWSTYYGGEKYYQGSNAAFLSNDQVQAVAVWADQRVYIGGWTTADESFPYTVDLTNYPSAFIQYENSGDAFDTPDGWYDGFLGQFELTGTILSTEEIDPQLPLFNIGIFPNPSDGSFEIVGTDLTNDNAIIDVYNIVGQKVYHELELIAGGKLNHNVQLSNEAMGVYVVKVTIGNKTLSKKIVVR